jgi:hypothetical protein
LRPGFRVVEKHFVEIAEAKKQNGFARQLAFDTAILRHHRRQLGIVAHGDELRNFPRPCRKKTSIARGETQGPCFNQRAFVDARRRESRFNARTQRRKAATDKRFEQRAHLSFCAVWISSSPPQIFGGEGRGEEAILKKPLSLSLSPLARGEGIESSAARLFPKNQMRPESEKRIYMIDDRCLAGYSRVERCLFSAVTMKIPFLRTVAPFLVFQFGLAICHNAAAAVAFTVTPSIVSNTYSGPITLKVTGLIAGDTVVVQKYLDVNTNGVIDSQDLLWQQFNLTDGASFVIGGVTNNNVPGDTDSVSGQITATLNFQTDFSQTIVGKYVFQVFSLTGKFPLLTNSFTVTGSPYAQKFTGTVVSNGVAVPYAAILLFQSGGGNDLNPVGGTVANSAGNYTIQAPAGTYAMAALKQSYVANTGASSGIVLGSGSVVTTNLSLIPATETISGLVVDANVPSTNLPGVLVSVESSTGLLATGVTDADGRYSIGVTSNQWRVEVDSAAAAVSGYVGLQNKVKVDTTSGSVSNVTIALPKATAFVYGTVKDSLGNPFPGEVAIFAQDQNATNNSLYQSDGYTDTNGNYVVGIIGGTNTNDLWYLSVDNSTSYTNYDFSNPLFDQNGGTNIATGTALRANFVAILATTHITGNVQFNGSPVAGVQINASSEDTNNFQAQAITDTNGNYSLNVVNGSWNVSVSCDGGNNTLSSVLNGGSFQCPCSVNVVVANNTPSANFMVVGGGSGQISGYVTNASGAAISGVTVSATDCSGDYNSATTGGNGFYSMSVVNGSWMVNVDCNYLGNHGYNCVNTATVTVVSNTVQQNFTVQPFGSGGGGSPKLGSPTKSGGQFQFSFSGASGQNYTVQVTTNLNSSNWFPLYVTNGTTTNFLITDPNATNQQRFYRLLIGP